MLLIVKYHILLFNKLKKSKNLYFKVFKNFYN